ncbi:hypothetical protein FOZ60_003194 [Perkinsus olseni]|uniref:PRA1 family protein n=1 Tax=Perkinsus olseni TaxID=32597 RepID=A0A7J6NW41_PEROL|nr:hypothetical protein FOZ60_003194 [Perkinsus olseni]
MSSGIQKNEGTELKTVSMAEPPAEAAPGTPSGLDSGPMDGVREPRNKLEELKMYIMPVVARYGHLVRLVRPWREFVQFSKPTKEGEVQKRITGNIQYFQANYAICVLAILSLGESWRQRWGWQETMLASAGVWFVFLGKNEDPNWKPKINGMELSKTQRTFGLLAVTLLLVLIFAGGLIMSVLGISAGLTIVHAAFNSGTQFEALDEAEQALDQI